MLKTTRYMLPFMTVIMMAVSCSKETNINPTASSSSSTAAQTISASVVSGESYALSFDQSTNMSISRQAAHFQTSTTSKNNETGKMTYTYVSAAGFSGDDEVTLIKAETTDQNPGGGCSNGNHDNTLVSIASTSYVTVKIRVTK